MFSVGKFLWDVRCSFGNLSEYFWVKKTENFLTNSKNGYSTEFSTEINHASKWSSGHVKRRFKKPAENMSPKSRKICRSETKNSYLLKISLKSNPKFKKKHGFWKSFPHGLFLWTQRIQFWQPWRKTFGVNPKNFGLKSDKQVKKFFFRRKGFPWRPSSGNVEFSSDNTVKKSCVNSQKIKSVKT